MPSASDFQIRKLGEPRFDSPIVDVARGQEKTPRFVEENERILVDDHLDVSATPETLRNQPALELAGPRQQIFFDPARTSVGIVTCGGLCPGINDVVRGIVMQAWHRYGIRRIYGFRYGYRGFFPKYGHDPLELTPDLVSDIHQEGGSKLGSSRGQQETEGIVDRLQEMKIDILYTIGGDGTLHGAMDISEEVQKRGAKIAIIGVPKTIDNDVLFIDESFGFETAYSVAVEAIISAHNEAEGTLNGIGLVKVMGRHSGFLACHAALATSHVNFVIIPEMPFTDNSPQAFAEALLDRLKKRRHAVVLVAEGVGQNQPHSKTKETDASGNIKFRDIGLFLAERIRAYLDTQGIEYSLKYIDPSYMVRSVQATPADSVYCWRLAQNAVHAAMSGRTEMIVGKWHGRLVHVPIPLAISGRKLVDPASDLWLSVLETTGQPAVFEWPLTGLCTLEALHLREWRGYPGHSQSDVYAEQ